MPLSAIAQSRITGLILILTPGTSETYAASAERSNSARRTRTWPASCCPTTTRTVSKDRCFFTSARSTRPSKAGVSRPTSASPGCSLLRTSRSRASARRAAPLPQVPGSAVISASTWECHTAGCSSDGAESRQLAEVCTAAAGVLDLRGSHRWQCRRAPPVDSWPQEAGEVGPTAQLVREPP